MHRHEQGRLTVFAFESIRTVLPRLLRIVGACDTVGFVKDLIFGRHVDGWSDCCVGFVGYPELLSVEFLIFERIALEVQLVAYRAPVVCTRTALAKRLVKARLRLGSVDV